MNDVDRLLERQVPKVLIVCDRPDTAPVWGYIVRQQGFIALLEQSSSKARESWSRETPDVLVIDIDIIQRDPVELCREFRGTSVTPILLLLPAHDETRILAAYAAGVDEVVIKPVSPAIFMAKITAWVRRSGIMPLNGLALVKVPGYRLDVHRRSLLGPGEAEVKLTNLEFRILHLLMSRPGQVFSTESLIESIWGGYGNGDSVLVKNIIYRLRRKVEVDPGNPLLIRTAPGGYYFQG